MGIKISEFATLSEVDSSTKINVISGETPENYIVEPEKISNFLGKNIISINDPYVNYNNGGI